MAEEKKIDIEKVEDLPIEEVEGFYHNFETEQSIKSKDDDTTKSKSE